MHNLQLWDIDTAEEAIDFIRASVGTETAFVGFSGGKDSIVTAELMRLAGVKYELYYSFTGIDAPEVVRFIRRYYPQCHFIRPRRTFWRELSVKSPPSNRLRWCCTALKKEPSWRLPHKLRAMGIRAEESVRRATYGRVVSWHGKLNHTRIYPVFHWKEWQVWDFINDRQLPVPPLYGWGFDRIGCVVCPYHSEKTGEMHQKYRDRWPKYFARWEKGVDELFEKRKAQGKIMHYGSASEFLEAWYLDDSARWYAKEQ